jgi:hypothetical protein
MGAGCVGCAGRNGAALVIGVVVIGAAGRVGPFVRVAAGFDNIT